MRRMALDKKNNQLELDSDSKTQEMRGEGYAPVFDHLMLYSRQVLRSSEMENWMLWCRNKFNICVCKMKEYGSMLDYRKKLEETQQKVHELEEKLKEAERRAAETSSSHNSTSVPPAPLPTKQAIPPPPPPPCPTIKMPTSNKLNIVKKSNTLKSQQSLSKMLVTPEAIRGVKLRKAEDRLTELKPQDTPGLVTLEALRSVSLRRTQSATTIQEVGKENIHQLLAHEVLHRRALRKTTIKRSPGGTPLSDKKRKRDSGQGLTPVMSRALKRKFRLAKCESMSSDESANSSPNQSVNEPSENTPASVTNQPSALPEQMAAGTRNSNENSLCDKMSPSNIAQGYRQSPLATISPNILADSSFISASSPNLVF